MLPPTKAWFYFFHRSIFTPEPESLSAAKASKIIAIETQSYVKRSAQFMMRFIEKNGRNLFQAESVRQ